MKASSRWVRAVAGLLCALPVAGAALVAADDPPQWKEAAKKLPSQKQAAEYKALFEKVGRAGLVELTKDKDTSLALQASWELHKKFARPNPNPEAPEWGKYDPDELKKFLAFLKGRTKAPVPEWWATGALDLRVKKGEWHMRRPGKDEPALKEVKVGEWTWRVREGVTLTQRDGTLSFTSGDVSFEYPKEARAGLSNSLADVVGEKRTYLAAYSSSGGLPFMVAAFENKGGNRLWVAEVWATGRRELIGPSAGHRVEMTTKGEALFLFGAEDNGLYAEAFDLETGKCQFRFCTSYWGNYSEEWNRKPGD